MIRDVFCGRFRQESAKGKMKVAQNAMAGAGAVALSVTSNGADSEQEGGITKMEQMINEMKLPLISGYDKRDAGRSGCREPMIMLCVMNYCKPGYALGAWSGLWNEKGLTTSHASISYGSTPEEHWLCGVLDILGKIESGRDVHLIVPCDPAILKLYSKAEGIPAEPPNDSNSPLFSAFVRQMHRLNLTMCHPESRGDFERCDMLYEAARRIFGNLYDRGANYEINADCNDNREGNQLV